MTIDPTRPLYETTSSELPLTGPSKIMSEVFRFIKHTNHKALWGWDQSDFSDCEQNAIYMYGRHGEHILSEALRRLKEMAQSTLVDYGDFYRLAKDVKNDVESQKPRFMPISDPNDWREQETQLKMLQQEREVDSPKVGSKSISKYWLRLIKHDLKNGKILKPLPYDKNLREPS